MGTIKYQKEGSLATITLNRPDVLNSFNREMAMEFQKALDSASTDPEVRAVMITGEGRAFSAGQDLAEVTAENGPEIDSIVREHYNPVISRIREIEKPVIAAVNGVAAGAGANIALACDVVIAAENASFIQAFSKIGLIPDSGGTYTLPRLVGWGKASALMMLGDKIGATEAESLGMIYKVVPDNDLMEVSKKISVTLSEMPTRGLALTKQALNRSSGNDLHQQLDLEEKLQNEAGSTHDYNEGVSAFLAKRKPEFKGC